jgi:hypothetical protein
MYHYSYSLARRRIGGGIVDVVALRSLEDRKDVFYPTQFVMTNLKPIGHHVRSTFWLVFRFFLKRI